MADELLSQAELDSLLANLQSGVAPKVRESQGHSLKGPHAAGFVQSTAPDSHSLTAEGSWEHAAKIGRQTAAQGTRPRDPRLPAAQLQTAGAVHESFARAFSTALSALLRSVVEVKCVSLEELSYGELVAGLPNPSCSSLVHVAPGEANWVLDVSPSLAYAIIDRMLGGGREPSPLARRALTEIELRLISRVTRLLLDELAKAWSPTVQLDFTVQRVESNPRLLLAAPAPEGMLLAALEVTMGNARGPIVLGMPVRFLASVDARPGAAAGSPATSTSGAEESGPAADGPLRLVVRLADTNVTAEELRNLQVGDIIATEAEISGPLAVYAADVEQFRAQLGAFDGHKAIRIETRVEGPRQM